MVMKTPPKTYGMQQKREVYSSTVPPKQKKTRKILNNLRLHLKQLEKEQQKALKVNRRKEIIKIRAEINEMEKKKTIATISETKHCFFEKINKINKPLARIIKNKRQRTQISKTRYEKEITIEL